MNQAWHQLRKYTAARIAIGRSGGSIPTNELLNFRLAHARAKDAVYSPFFVDKICNEFELIGFETEILESQASSRQEFLLKPHLGRCLKKGTEIKKIKGGIDVALIVSDGLSALAIHENAVRFFATLGTILADSGIHVSPIFIVPNARVAIQDEIGETLGARLAVIAIGERPGLGTPDSMGIYFVYNPKIGKSDADRNCISNIRDQGLIPHLAAEKLSYLIRQSLVLQLSGVGLKDDWDLKKLSLDPEKFGHNLKFKT